MSRFFPRTLPAPPDNKLKLNYLLMLPLLVSSGCTTMSWEDRYDEVAEPLRTEYQERAEKLTSDVYNYSFKFNLENEQNKVQTVIFHPQYADDLVTLSDQDKSDLIKKMGHLKNKKGLRLFVVGHTNNTGLRASLQKKFADNTALSATRAKHVADFLRLHFKIKEDKVNFIGAGANQSSTDNDTAGERTQNSRIEINSAYASQQHAALIKSAARDPDLAPLPDGFKPWWGDLVVGQIHPESTPQPFNLASLVIRALRHSTQMKVFSELPLIRKTMVEEAEGKFDIHAFVEAKYAETNEPVGSTLRTGDEDRFKEHAWQAEVGLRRKIVTGGEVEISQELGGKDNNSRFFQPHDQGNSRFMLTIRHRLLNGFGYAYNQSQIEIARVDYNVSMDEFTRQIASHILEIERAYWGLYLERVNLLQKKKLYSEAEKVVEELQARRGIDVLANQLQQAKAVRASRYAASIRSEQSVRNAEGKILALVNDPSLIMDQNFELSTTQSLGHLKMVAKVNDAAQNALQNRPEITQSFKQLKAGMVRAAMADNEVLPALDLVFETTLKGLSDDYDVFASTGNQFTQGRPSWTLGLRLDWPLGNRIAKARQRRRQLEVRQLVQQLRTTIETILLEVQVSVREINTSYREMLSQYQAMIAMQANLDTLNARRQAALGRVGRSQYLEQLLDSQEDLATAEHRFLESQVAYNISQGNLERAQGILLAAKKIGYEEGTDDDTGLPVMNLVPLGKKGEFK